MSLIRACVSEDMPAVAALFQKTFIDRRKPASPALGNYLTELFLRHPWHDPELTSRVYVSPEGAVRGFQGVLPLRLCFRGRSIRAALAGSLMVDSPEQNPLAGARLLRSFAHGPQQLSISESANRVSEHMWQKLGGRTVPGESLEWLRVLRPAGLALAFARQWFAPAVVLQPLAAAIDRAARGALGNPLEIEPARGEYDAEASEELLLEHIPGFAESYSMRPAWNPASLQWVLAHARTKARRGPISRRMVYGKDGAPIGCYVYYGRPRGIGWVLQILARPERTQAVIESLLAHAYRHGSVAVRGRAHPRLMNALLRRGAVFFHRSATVVHSADGELLDAVLSGDALVTGLAGEAWTRLIGDGFA